MKTTETREEWIDHGGRHTHLFIAVSFSVRLEYQTISLVNHSTLLFIIHRSSTLINFSTLRTSHPSSTSYPQHRKLKKEQDSSKVSEAYPNPNNTHPTNLKSQLPVEFPSRDDEVAITRTPHSTSTLSYANSSSTKYS